MACNQLFRDILDGSVSIDSLTTPQIVSLWGCLNEQDKVLFRTLIDSRILAGGGGGGGTTHTEGAEASNLIAVTTAGTVADGFYEYSVANVGEAAGTLDGVPFPVGASVTYRGYVDEVSKEMRLPQGMAYDASGTTFLISSIDYTSA